MFKSTPRLASSTVHREIADDAFIARRRSLARCAAILQLLETEHEIRALDVLIAEYEELLARLAEDQPFKPGRHRLNFGGLRVDLVLSSKPQLRELVQVLKSRRDELCGREGARRRSQAEAVAEHLRRLETSPIIEPRPNAAEPLAEVSAATSRWA